MDWKVRDRRLKSLGYSSYAQYLCCDHWRELKRRIRDQRGHKCERCPRTADLQVHHDTYERLGQEKESDLLLLCEPCHEREHERIKQKNREERRANRKTRRRSGCCGVPLVLRKVTGTQWRNFCTKCGQRNHRYLRRLRLKK